MSVTADKIGQFYLYTLTDPRTGSVFYVGKGQKERLFDHQREAERGMSGHKCAKIREIIRSGHRVTHTVVARYTCEDGAYDAERSLIREIGLHNLTNIQPGGRILGARFKQKRQGSWSMGSLKKLAPKISHCLREISKHGNLFAMGYSVETQFKSLVNKLIEDLGLEAVNGELRRFGVELLTENNHGKPSCQ